MKNGRRLRVFAKTSSGALLGAVAAAAPRAASFPVVRSGVSRAVRTLKRSHVLQLVGVGDELRHEEADLQRWGSASMASAATMLGHILQPLRDWSEYRLFSDIALPPEGRHEVAGVWSPEVGAALHRHYLVAAALRREFGSAPRWRRDGADYSEDMLWMCARTIARPGIVRFGRHVEREFGWEPVERSGMTSLASFGPQH